MGGKVEHVMCKAGVYVYVCMSHTYHPNMPFLSQDLYCDSCNQLRNF